MIDLSSLRASAFKLILIVLWLLVPLIAFASWNGEQGFAATSLALSLALLMQFLAKRDLQSRNIRALSGIFLVVSTSLLIAAAQGLKVQVDLHMYYFAALALLVAYCDWRAIVISAVFVTFHHLILNFAFPSLIYSGGADFGRFSIHAGVLIFEAAALGWVAFAIEHMFEVVSKSVSQAEAAQSMAEQNHEKAVALAAKAELAHQINERDRSETRRDDEIILHHLATSLSHLAAGHLDFSLDAVLPQKAETLRSNLNSVIENLQTVMVAVLRAVNRVQSGVNDMSLAADHLSSRTHQQSSNLEEVAGALGEITKKVFKTTDKAKLARDVVGTTKGNADTAHDVVRQAVDAMNNIEKSSGQISKIIGVIDEISFQTNLLALNAGVEAARAGEAGRGFAVVASEVRALAQRAAASANEIKTLISASSTDVKHGVELVGKTGAALTLMLNQIAEINSIVIDIAHATEEQNSGLGQINAAVSQIDQVTQKNAAMVEESIAATHSLQNETDELNQLIGRFKLGDLDASSIDRLAVAA